MINSISLRNWKAYDRLELNLRPGTNFLVSRNGVGKTSFVEAISWAMLGSDLSRIDADDSCRSGRDASVTLSMTWTDDVTATVTRSVVRRPNGRSYENVEFAIAGESGTGHPAWMSELSRLWHASGELLGRLMIMGEHSVWDELAEPVSADVNRAVRELLQLDVLEAVFGEARRQALRSEREAKAAPRIDQERLGLVRQQFEAARAAHEAQEAKVQALRRLHQRRSDERRVRVELTSWESQQRQSLMNALAIAQRIPEAVGVLADGADLDAVTEFVSQSVLSAERQLASERTALEITERHLSELVADQDCPVCLRSLDETTVDYARDQHEGQLESMRHRVATLESQRDELSRAKSEVDLLQRQAAAPRPVASPDHTEVDPAFEALSDDELLSEDRTSAELVERLRDEMGIKRSELSGLEASSRAWDQSLLATRRQALGLLVQATARSVSTELTNRAAEPLVQLVREQWKKLPLGQFLGIDEAGRVYVERDGRRLGYATLSGGEKAQVVLLYRVAALKALTRVPIFVLDEPLEHMDPRNRWTAGRMICALSSSGAFSQTLVTTYEESLARRLALQAEQHSNAPVSLCYLSID